MMTTLGPDAYKRQVFTSLDTVNVLLDVLEEITMGVSTIDQN